jgi:hypothetical protein
MPVRPPVTVALRMEFFTLPTLLANELLSAVVVGSFLSTARWCEALEHQVVLPFARARRRHLRADSAGRPLPTAGPHFA